MGGGSAILSAWDFAPSIIIGCAGLLLLDLALVRWRISRMSGWYVAGVAALAFALMSPLDELGDEYLFSAHMVQHLFLVLIVPPLLLGGFPETVMRQLLRVPWIASVERTIGAPLVAWLAGIVTLACWHLPVLYNATMTNKGIHIFEHLSFLVTATIFWWPIFAPVQEYRVGLATAFTYLVTGTFANGVIGAVLLALPAGLYPAYLHPADPMHILHFIRDTWGLSPAGDQHLGAVIMIIGGSVAFMYAAFSSIWLHRDERLVTD